MSALHTTIRDELLRSRLGFLAPSANDQARNEASQDADAVLDTLYAAGWLRDDPTSKRHHIARWDAERQQRVAELEAFVQRYIDLGFEDPAIEALMVLHDEAVKLLPEPAR